jgi:hypothetical protein
MGGRDERRELLRQSKGFTCVCERCVGPDREAALPCLSCAPLAQRPHGFMAPADTDSTHPGANTEPSSTRHFVPYQAYSGMLASQRWL